MTAPAVALDPKRAVEICRGLLLFEREAKFARDAMLRARRLAVEYPAIALEMSDVARAQERADELFRELFWAAAAEAGISDEVPSDKIVDLARRIVAAAKT